MIHAGGDNNSDHPKSLDGSDYRCHIRHVVKQHRVIDMTLSTQLLSSALFHHKVGKHLSVNGDLLLFDDAKSKTLKKGLGRNADMRVKVSNTSLMANCQNMCHQCPPNTLPLVLRMAKEMINVPIIL